MLEQETVPVMESVPFNEIQLGMEASHVQTITQHKVQLFALLSGDYNPLHLDEEYAKTTQFGGCIAHGAFCALLISAAVANKLPGPGSIYVGQTMRFKKPVYVGDTLTTTLKIVEKKGRSNIVLIDNLILNQKNEKVFVGQSTVIAPSEKTTLKPASAGQWQDIVRAITSQ